ncbi:MAG: hypothetical protein QM763_02795 [Agriterribacter sp.]
MTSVIDLKKSDLTPLSTEDVFSVNGGMAPNIPPYATYIKYGQKLLHEIGDFARGMWDGLIS